MTLHEKYRFFISFLYPNICPCCETVIEHDEDFCFKCGSKLSMFNAEFKINHVDRFTAYCYYEGKIRHAIRKFKFTPVGNSYYAFAFGIVQALRRNMLTAGLDGVVFIPMTENAQKIRGYNQVELIADEVHYLLDIPVYNALKKNRATRKQKALTGEQRSRNIKGAFSINNEIDVKGKKLLLIDDVCTTGNTLSEAARVLKEAGASVVIAASFAKTRDFDDKTPTL